MAVDSEGERYESRKKGGLKLNGQDNAALSPQLNASMAVVLEDSLQGASHDDILQYLFLSSELRGAIDSPAYYFSHDPGVKETANLLMMTQGWSRLRQIAPATPLNPPAPPHNP